MIVFSAIGYNKQEVKIGARSTIDIVMKVDVSELNPEIEKYRTPKLVAMMFYYFLLGYKRRIIY